MTPIAPVPGRPRRLRVGVLVLAAAATFVASAVRAEELDPKALRVPAVRTVLHLARTFRYEDPDAKGIFATRTPERGLLAGDYLAEFEDDGGTFYRGAGTCVLLMTLPRNGEQIFADGGVYVPKDRHKPFRLYRYRQLGTEHVLAAAPDANGDWSVSNEQAGRALMIVGSMAGWQREPNPPESLCGVTAPQDAGNEPPGVVVVARVPRSPVAGGVSSGLATLLLNAIIANGRGKIFREPAPPDGVHLAGAMILPVASAAAASSVDTAGTEASGAASSPASAATSAARPASLRHLDASMVDGHTWSFPHLRDPARFGSLELRFADGRVQARNARGEATGRYVVRDDKVCLTFDADGWAPVCFAVVDGAAAGPSVVNPATGATAPLDIR